MIRKCQGNWFLHDIDMILTNHIQGQVLNQINDQDGYNEKSEALEINNGNEGPRAETWEIDPQNKVKGMRYDLETWKQNWKGYNMVLKP